MYFAESLIPNHAIAKTICEKIAQPVDMVVGIAQQKARRVSHS